MLLLEEELDELEEIELGELLELEEEDETELALDPLVWLLGLL